MTTICTDNRTIAADGQETWGDEVTCTDAKKIHVEPGVIYALSGAVSMRERLVEWEKDGARGSPPSLAPEMMWTLLVIRRKDGLRVYTSKCPYPSIVPARFAIGSGADYATAAMHCGLSPEQAVALVRDRRLDVWTGGEIQVVDIAEALSGHRPHANGHAAEGVEAPA